MLSVDLRRQLRRLRIRARRAVLGRLAGQYRSAFKGQGLAFEDVREYDPGDDVRGIDWNVTARMGHAYVKRFVEERELTVLLALDCSASQMFGSTAGTKAERGAESAALLAASALGNQDRVGLVRFTERIEAYLPPARGPRRLGRILGELTIFSTQRPGTDLAGAIRFVQRVTPRRAVIFLISDFLAEGYAEPLQRLGSKHDVIALRLADPREQEIPSVGLVEVQDAETGRIRLIDTSHAALRRSYAQRAVERRLDWLRTCRAAGVDPLDLDPSASILNCLVALFQRRQRQIRVK